MQRNSVLGKGKGEKEETVKGEGEVKVKGKDGEDQESKHEGNNEVEKEVKENGKDGDKNEGKVGGARQQCSCGSMLRMIKMGERRRSHKLSRKNRQMYSICNNIC